MLQKKNIFKFVFWIFLLVAFILICGKLLDLEAERVVSQLYSRDNNGIIKGLEPIVVNNHHKKALMIVHGFLESPANFSELISDIKNKIPMDIYVPLLPYHGRNLEKSIPFDNKVIVHYIKSYIDMLSKKYQSVTIMGLSYGGSVLTAIASQEKLPKNVHLILYSPAIFLKSNTAFTRFEIRFYRLWRNYCNYPTLGCNFPSYESVDETAKPTLEAEKTLRYKVIPAVLQLYALDLQNRDRLSQLAIPFSLIVAEDDNRVFYEKLKNACDENKKFCHFYSFPSGRHIIHWGKNKKAFEALLIKLCNNT